MTDTKTATRKSPTSSKPKAKNASAPEVAPGAPPKTEKSVKPVSKIAQVIALLERPEGATLEEMIVATGWLPHTTRAALTGLKKKGHVITRDKRGEVTCYKIVAAA